MDFPSSLSSTLLFPGVETVIIFFSSSNSIRSFSRVTKAFVWFSAVYSYGGLCPAPYISLFTKPTSTSSPGSGSQNAPEPPVA